MVARRKTFREEHAMPNAVAYLDESTASVWERNHG